MGVENLFEEEAADGGAGKGGSRRAYVIFTQYGPYMVVDLKDFQDAEGKPLPSQPVMSLGRCGKSASKPYYGGSPKDINFDDSK